MAIQWSDIYSEQVPIIRKFNKRLERVEQHSIPVTFVGDSAPDQIDINQSWVNSGVGSAPLNSKAQWFNPVDDKIRNVYYQLSGAVSHPDIPEIDSLTELIMDFNVREGDTPVTNISCPNFDKEYTSVLVLWGIKTTATTNINAYLRANNNTSSAVWDHSAPKSNQVPAYAGTGANSGNRLLLGLIANSNAASMPFAYSYGMVEFFYPFSSSEKHFFFDTVQSYSTFITGQFVGQIRGGGLYKLSTVVNNLTLGLDSGSFAVGSKVLFIGMNPR